MKRRVIQLVLLLVAGAIVNVAVAWGCAIKYGSDQMVKSRLIPPPREQHRPWKSLTAEEQKLLVSAGWPQPTPDRELLWAAVEETEFAAHHEVTYYPFAEIRGIVNPGSANQEFRGGYFPIASPKQAIVVCSTDGWPCQSFRAAQLHYAAPRQGAATIAHHRSWALPTLLGVFPRSSGYFVPLDPIWLGSAVNSGFYALLLMIAFLVFDLIRRKLRIKRGLCPACAYPIGSSPMCTECGKPLKFRKCMGLPPPATLDS